MLSVEDGYICAFRNKLCHLQLKQMKQQQIMLTSVIHMLLFF